MTKIDKYIVQRIKDTADIVDIVGDFITLKKSGIRYLGLCPFHDDKNLGSFVVYPKGNVFKCFACDAKGGPIEFLMKHENLSFPDAIRWLGKKYSIDTNMEDFNYTPPPPRPKPAPLPTLTLPFSMVNQRMVRADGQDNLVEWIRTIPWDAAQRARIDKTLREYYVGHSCIMQRTKGGDIQHDFTLFWQIDKDGHPRTAHYMKYKPDGHRMHKEDNRYNTDWFHSLLERHGLTQYYNTAKQEVRQCLFGEHLLTMYPNADVHIVESEKSAIIMAIAYGNHAKQVFMACCGESNLTKEKLEPLIAQQRRILLYPDRDAIQMWQQRAKKIGYEKISISTNLVKNYWQPEDGKKADCADVVVRLIRRNNTMSPAEKLSDIMRRHPVVGELVNKLNLEPQ